MTPPPTPRPDIWPPLPYEAVRTASEPGEVAAGAGGWVRAALECAFGESGVPRAI